MRRVQKVRVPLDIAPTWIQYVRSVKRIISRKRLRDYALQYPQAKPSLEHWERVTLAARWETPLDVRRTFNDADAVKVRSGNTVDVFNIQRNEHRLIAAIHFNTHVVYVLRLMAHKDYDKGHWKDEL
jgi:mRNA interferase HigB